MSGTIPYSLSQQFDEFGKPLSGGKLYLIEAGTTSTPQNGYQDSALTLALPNPLICDAAGRLPQFFLADGVIKVRLTDINGVTQVVADNIQVIGASSGSGGGGTVDETTVLATGDIKCRYGTGALSGFVRLNGRTIGSATSGASERANLDTQALFEYLWGIDSTAVVGGAGSSASADWTANKRITLPDFRGRVMAGMDDMGNTAAGRLTSAGAVSGTTLGYGGGSQFHTLTQAQMPQHQHPFSGNTGIESNDHTHNYSAPGNTTGGASGSDYSAARVAGSTPTGGISDHHTHPFSGTTSLVGSSDPHNNVQPTITVTTYIKL